MIPVLMITYDRLQYSKRALEALMNSHEVSVHVIDNGSTDGTVAWLQQFLGQIRMSLNRTNEGIAGAMNQFLRDTAGSIYVGKVDNDTIVPGNWATKLREKCVRHKIEIIQAKHPLIAAVAEGRSFDEWVLSMKTEPTDHTIRYHHFVGGSGIIFKRRKVMAIPQTEWKLYGWRQFQKEHPELKKAFCTEVEIELLDTCGYHEFPDYYKQTGRL